MSLESGGATNVHLSRMQDTLFDLGTLEEAAPGAVQQSSLAAALAKRATNQTRARSNAIAAWVGGRKLSGADSSGLEGSTLLSAHGQEYLIRRVLARPDGDASLVVASDEEDGFNAVEVCVRADGDGSFLTATGERFVLGSSLPAPGENSGNGSEIAVGDVCLGVGFGPHVITARRGRWGFARELRREDSDTICFLGDAIKVPAEFVPTLAAPLTDDVFARAVGVGGAARRTAIADMLVAGRSVDNVRHLWGEFTRLPKSLRDDATVKLWFGALIDVFEFQVDSGDWRGSCELDLSYGWRLDVRFAGVKASSIAEVELEFDVLLGSPEFPLFFDPSSRADVVARALDADAASESGAPPTPTKPPVPREKKSLVNPAAVVELRARAAGLAGSDLTDAERGAIAPVLSLPSAYKPSAAEFGELSRAVDGIIARLRGVNDSRAEGLLGCSAWSAHEIAVAREICESSVGLSRKFSHAIEIMLAGYAGVVDVAEVAPGWWAAVNAGSVVGSGCHGAVSVTGYHSLCQSGITSANDAAARFVADKADSYALPREPRTEDVLRWIRGQSVAIEHNAAHSLLSWIDRHRRTQEIRDGIATALKLLDGDSSDSLGLALQSSLTDTRWLDDRDQMAATCAAYALAAKFGEAKPAPRESGLFDDAGGKAEEPDGTGGAGDDEE